MIAVLPMAILAPVTAPAHSDYTYASLSVAAWGDKRVLKDVEIEVGVHDEDTDQTVVHCMWEGERNDLSEDRKTLDRAVCDFSIRLTVWYKGEEIVEEPGFVHMNSCT
ncbi:hypothetical protein [Methanopyrus sp.]